MRAAHKPVQRTVRIPMRADLVDEISVLEQQARRERDIDARENRDPVAPRLAERIRELDDQLAASEVAFTFRGIGRRAYQALIAAHPPTDEQQASARDAGVVLSYNPDTFPPALLAAACILPEGATLADMTDIWETWSEGQASQLWTAVLTANMGSADVGPKSLIASEILAGSAKS
jgi:hypothetical protein